MTWSLAIYIFFVQYAAFIIKGLVGFGNPLLSTPLLAMRMDNGVITPGNLLIDLPVNGYIVFKNRKVFDPRATLPVTALIILGVIPGTFLLKLGSPWVIKAVLGVLIIGLGLEMLLRKTPASAPRPNVVMDKLIPFVSGIMAGLFGINLLFLSYFERTAKDRGQFRSNVCFVFLIENAARALLYAFSGMFTLVSLQMTAITIPAAVLGVMTGNIIDKHIKEHTAKRMVVVVFLLGGVSILIKALIYRA